MPQDTGRQFGSVSRRNFLLGAGATGAVALAGCTQEVGDGGGNGGGSTDADQLSGEVIIKGSSTVFPVSDTLAELFMEEHPQVNVTVDSTGTGGGFQNHFCTGESDINGASRPIKEGEVEQCSTNDVDPVEFEVAGDALTMAVNNDADWVDCVTPEELSQIWRDDGAERWSDLRDEWPDRQFRLFGPSSASGTYDWFSENIIGEEYRHTADHQPTEEDETIVRGIRDNLGGMGYFGYAYYSANPEQVKALEVDGGQGCTPPGLDTAREGSYPMARPLFIYAAESSLQDEAVYEFMRFYLEQAATDTISEVGYVPSSDDQREANLDTLEEAAGR
jgi:phosphate transport system substrate-binding protein